MLPSSTSLVPCCSLPQTPHLKTAAFTAGSLPDLQQNLACTGAAGESDGEVGGGVVGRAARCHVAGRPSSPGSGHSDPPQKFLWDSRLFGWSALRLCLHSPRSVMDVLGTRPRLAQVPYLLHLDVSILVFPLTSDLVSPGSRPLRLSLRAGLPLLKPPNPT